jgi:hypothetical protein
VQADEPRVEILLRVVAVHIESRYRVSIIMHPTIMTGIYLAMCGRKPR